MIGSRTFSIGVFKALILFVFTVSSSGYSKVTVKKKTRWLFIPVVPHTSLWNKNNSALECSFYNTTAIYAKDYSRDNRQIVTLTGLNPKRALANAKHKPKGGNKTESFELKLNQSYTKEYMGKPFPRGLWCRSGTEVRVRRGRFLRVVYLPIKKGLAILLSPSK